ncbi:MAG: hypothetical protein QUS11_04350 [Candidatus Fermentibacter sp.]|nr:hypothetical protein [Candidatus Fermentibacter sp.]
MQAIAGLVLAAVLSRPGIPYFSADGAGTRSVSLSARVVLEVVSADSSWSGGGESHYYSVDGLRMVSEAGADTITWIADLPAQALASARAAGSIRSEETRTLRILACTESYIGGRITVRSDRDGRLTSSYEALRTWLLSGVPLDLESVVQTDSVFTGELRAALDAPPSADLDIWLWSRGHWLDPQSFVIWMDDGSPLLRMGLPSWTGSDSLLIVELDLARLNTAHGAMLD